MKNLDPNSEKFKNYEKETETTLEPEKPIIVRLDGKAFHTFTKQSWCESPFSDILVGLFEDTMKYLCENCRVVAWGITRVTKLLWCSPRIMSIVNLSWAGGFKRLCPWWPLWRLCVSMLSTMSGCQAICGGYRRCLILVFFRCRTLRKLLRV